MFLSLLPAETDSTYTDKSTLPTAAVGHHQEDCIVDRAHGFDTIRHVHSSHKDGSSFRVLGPSVASW